jgi:hypothetical protein
MDVGQGLNWGCSAKGGKIITLIFISSLIVITEILFFYKALINVLYIRIQVRSFQILSFNL